MSAVSKPSFQKNPRSSSASGSHSGSQAGSQAGSQGSIASGVRPALVLGRGGSAERIASQLRAEGFATQTSGEALPALSDPRALDQLRSILTRFAERTRGGGVVPAVHPGVTVWAERAELATLGEELGLDVICPPARVLALFSNKLNLLGEADRLGVPHLVMSFDPIYGVREIERLIFNQALTRKPFPFVLKAVKGGGSFGVCVVQDADTLEHKIPLWVEQLRRNLGEVALFAERYIEGARHVLVPFVRTMDGRFEIFPMTDASLQCRYRKIVEFCPANEVSDVARELMSDWTRRLADQMGYVGVGTFEFLVDGPRVFLVEGTARLNTGFHLWERVAGTSAVAWQLAALETGPQGQKGREPVCAPKPEWGAGLVLRLYAEDSLLQLPQPGDVREVSEKREWHFTQPELGAAAELDLVLESGTKILPSGYGLVGMLWAGAENLEQAMYIARGALEEVWIAGSLQTNERFLAELLAHPWVKEGMFHAGFVDEEFLPAVRPPAEILPMFAGVLAGLPCEITVPAGAVTRWAAGDQWVKVEPVIWKKGPSYWDVESRTGASGSVELTDGRTLRVCAYPLSDNKWQVRIGSWVLQVRRVVRVPGEKPQRSPKLFALIHGRVHSLFFREGSIIPAHEPLLALDALGMLVPHSLPVEVRVKKWKVQAEALVRAGEELAEFELLSKT